MNYRDFISDNKLFKLKLPRNWVEYDDGEDNYAFFNTEKWSGNLRITHFTWENIEPEVDKVALYRESELADNVGSRTVKLGELNAIFYSKETEEGNIIYFWITGSKNDLFICSFTFDKPFLSADWHNNEIIVVSEILSSIKVIG